MALLDNALTQTLHTHFPFWQAPLPFNLITAETAGLISAQGALGLIRISAQDNCQRLQTRINAYKKHHPQPSFCFNHRLPKHQAPSPAPAHELYHLAEALKWHADESDLTQGDHFLDLLDLALSSDPRAIGFANGLPDKDTIAMIQAHGILTFAICHNLVEALVATEFDIDALVLQGMEAGGERSHFDNNLRFITQPAHTLLQQVRQHSNKPIILWGDFSTAADVVAAFVCGAHSVMLDRPWLACNENALSDSQRHLAIHATEFASLIDYNYSQRAMRYIAAGTPLAHTAPNPETREAIMEALFTHNPDARPLPISLSPIADPQTIQHFLSDHQARLQDFIA